MATACRPGTIRPFEEEISRLRAGADARRELASRALAGSLAGLGGSLDRIADDVEHEAIDVEALRRTADRAYEQGLAALQEEISHGRFLRQEALRHWQAYVGADQITRFFSEGIGRVRGAIAAIFRPATAPVAEVRAATTDDLLEVARLQAAEAARRTATAWAAEPGTARVVAEHAELWLAFRLPSTSASGQPRTSGSTASRPRSQAPRSVQARCSRAAPRSASTRSGPG